MVTQSCNCVVSGESFQLSPADIQYLTKRGYPIPKLSPIERQRRRLSYRNQRHLYRAKCAATGKSIISMYSPDYPGPVVTQEYWWGDDWDPLSFGREIDFSRPFFDQFKELFVSVPQPCTMVTHSENCEYNAYCARSKDCYLSQSVAECENIYYTFGPTNSRDCLDCHNISDNCELCYELLFASSCYDVRFSKNVANCRESSFLFNCRNCSNLFFCSNLRNAQYCFGNEQLSKEQYQDKVRDYLEISHSDKKELMTQFLQFQATQLTPALWGANNEDVRGNQIFHSKNVNTGFDIHNSEDVSYVTRCYNSKSCQDCNNVFIGEELYETISVINSSRSSFCFSLYEGVSDAEYSASISHSNDIFGCVGLRRKSYCILNKQYSKEDYFTVRAKLIEFMKETGEWGEFFPTSMSPFPFNDSVAQDFFPIAEEVALDRGYRWREPADERVATAQANALPELSSEADEHICEQVNSCVKCGKGYKIQRKEFQLIRKLHAPLPHECFECRYNERMEQLEPMRLKSTTCSTCGTAIDTCYDATGSRAVLCESCYASNVN